jgi:hypothetical protein
MNISSEGSLLGIAGGTQFGGSGVRQCARKHLLDFPTTRPWKDKTESPDKIQLELSKFAINTGIRYST